MCLPSRGGTEHQVFSVQDEFLTFISVKRMERKGGLFRVPLMIRNHPLSALGRQMVCGAACLDNEQATALEDATGDDR